MREIEALPAQKGCTPAQLALAWVLAQGDYIVPIPGTKRRRYLEENVGAVRVSLSEADLDRISGALPPGAPARIRHATQQMAALNR